MAVSTCIKCGSTSFENKVVTPQHSEFRLTFVQCSNCGGVVGVMDFFNIGEMLQTLAKKLGARDIG
jgi:uncharacterized Zn finger protein